MESKAKMAREHQFVARDFMGLGNMGDVQKEGDSKDCGTALKCHGVDFGHLHGAAAPITKGTSFNSIAFAGLNHPLWSSGTTFQHHLSSGNLHEEKLIEQSAESVPEGSFLRHPHQMQGRWLGDSIVKSSPTAADNFGLKSQVAGCFGGLPKKPSSFTTPNLNTPRFSEAAQRMPSAELAEKRDAAPLTIFYGGHVKVFNDITAEKAQAIMMLASTGNVKAAMSTGGASVNAMKFAMTFPSMQSPTANKASITGNLHNTTTINVPTRFQMDQENNSFNVEIGQPAFNQSGLGNANMLLDSGHPGVPNTASSQEQPIVPTALPQARKASLARFLERRRERVQSKSPYSLKQVDSSLPEERFSSSNDIGPHTYHNFTDEKEKISLPKWMERPHEYSSDGIMKEDTKLVSV